jgi:cell division protein FtsL
VIKVVLLCFLFCGSAVGYVWQKSEIIRLGRQISDRERKLIQLKEDNERLGSQVAILHSPMIIDERAKQLDLGLSPEQPGQVVYLYEPAAGAKAPAQQLAGRSAMDWVQ